MGGTREQGFLKLLRGDGSLLRVLLLALFVQILAPVLGFLPSASASAPTVAITVCTGHGIVTLVPDGNGGWTEEATSDAGLTCSFCLPLLSGNVGPVADMTIVALPAPIAAPAQPVVLLYPAEANPPGSSSPRAPPILR